MKDLCFGCIRLTLFWNKDTNVYSLQKKKKNKNFDAIRIKRINFPEFMIRENVEVIPFILISE